MSLSQIQNFADQIRPLIDSARSLKNSREAGSIYSVLHATVEQHLSVSTSPVDTLQKDVSVLFQNLEASPSENVRNFIILSQEQLYAACFLPVIQALKTESLKYPDPASQTTSSEVLTAIDSHSVRVLIIEDNYEWQKFVVEAVEEVQKELNSPGLLEYEVISDAQSAKEALDHLQNDRKRQVIAILDMGLPRDQNADILSVSRENGLNLLGFIRSYAKNIPTIVFTTPPEMLNDQLQVQALGVKDTDYILKSVENKDSLTNALRRILQRRHVHNIKLDLDEQNVFIDKVLIENLPPYLYEILVGLAALSRDELGFFEPEQIYEKAQMFHYALRDEMAVTRSDAAQKLFLKRKGTWWDIKWAVSIRNIMLHWDNLSIEAKTTVQTFNAFRRAYQTTLYPEALALLELYIASHSEHPLYPIVSKEKTFLLSAEDLAPYFEALFGGLNIKSDFVPQTVIKYMHSLRQAVHQATQHGQSSLIDARHQIIASRNNTPDPVTYRLLGNIEIISDNYTWNYMNDSSRKKAPKCVEKFRLLVVEDDKVHLQAILDLLKQCYTDIETKGASNFQDALRLALTWRPNILSLDMQIPNSATETTPINENGLRLLEAMYTNGMKDMKVIIASSLYNQDQLRARAVQLGVPIINFVTKGDAYWYGQLLSVVQRLKKEILLDAILPASYHERQILITVLKGSDFKEGRLNLSIPGEDIISLKKSKTGEILSQLLIHAGNPVSREDLISLLGKPATENALNQQLSKLRTKLRNKLKNPSILDNLLVTVSQGYKLNAIVINRSDV